MYGTSMSMYAKFNNKAYAVVTPEEYFSIVNAGGLSCYNDSKTMILLNGYLYPIRHSEPNYDSPKHGCYCFIPERPCIVRWITNDESYRQFELVNLNSPSCIEDLIHGLNRVNQIRKDALTPDTEEDIFKTEIHYEDTPIMVGLKRFITNKAVDLNKYSDRFGANFTNDVRILNKNDITIKKFLNFVQNLDGTCELVINNSSQDVANPINEEIRVKLI